jgi:hypothetical protein
VFVFICREDEQDVRAGKKVGTMWGIMTPEEAAEVLPEPATKPKKKDPDSNDADVVVDIESLGKRDPWKKERMEMEMVKKGSASDGTLNMSAE